MIDRQPTHAGRVQLVPVAGQTNIYDMTMADGATEQGTALNKANLLKDATAALYGLTSAAVPDDVLAWLGKFNLHCWKRRRQVWQEVLNGFTGTKTIATTSNNVIKYASTISFDGNGNIIFNNEQQLTVAASFAGTQSLVALAPCYIKNSFSNEIYFIPQGATAGDDVSQQYNATIYWWYSNNAHQAYYAANPRISVVSSVLTWEDWEFLFSEERNTYPDSGIVDGYEYQYCGIPFDNAASVHTKIETGSYVGTGTYGASNPNSLTFSFVPKYLIIKEYTEYRIHAFFPMFSYTSAYKANAYHGIQDTTLIDSSKAYAKVVGNTAYWYHTTSASLQLSHAGTTYNYIAIG